MSERRQGEPLGCLALVAALGTLALVLKTTPAAWELLGASSSGSAAAAYARRQTVDAETEAVRDEVRRLRDERMTARKERLLSTAAQYESGDQRQYRKLKLHNNCRFVVAVALHYLDLDDHWVTRGWWEVAAGGSLTADAMTRESVYYVYAENQSVGRTWDGRGRQDALSREISDEKFDQIDGEPFVFRSPRSASFAKRATPPPWADPVETFDCPVEEMPPPGSVAKPPSSVQGPRRP